MSSFFVAFFNLKILTDQTKRKLLYTLDETEIKMNQEFVVVLNFVHFLLNHEFPQIPPDRNPCYDGIRGFACVIVILAHCCWSFSSQISLTIIDSNGKSGVWLFFMLSSFLLTSQIFAWTIPEYCSGGKLWTEIHTSLIWD